MEYSIHVYKDVQNLTVIEIFELYILNVIISFVGNNK